jgi:hypothetical protein
MGKLMLVFAMLVGAMLAALLWLMPTPASAGTIYSWRTEDGGYAFSDDPDVIPARYRDQTQTRASAKLRDYERYTESDSESGDRYAEDLAARLERQRATNAVPAATGPSRATTAGTSATGPRISLRTGSESAPTIDVTPDSGAGPLVVETVFTRPAGKMVTRKSLIVRQGDKTIAVVRPRSVETNPFQIADESDQLR